MLSKILRFPGAKNPYVKEPGRFSRSGGFEGVP